LKQIAARMLKDGIFASPDREAGRGLKHLGHGVFVSGARRIARP